MKDIKYFLVFLICQFFFFHTSLAQNSTLDNMQGDWDGKLELQNQVNLYFSLEVVKEEGQIKAFLRNGKEELYFDEVSIKGDSLYFYMNLFDSYLAISTGSRSKDDAFIGKWVRLGLGVLYEVPLALWQRQDGMVSRAPDTDNRKDFSGKWAITFTDGKGKNTIGLGVFEQTNNQISNDYIKGTILTPSGDYRYLQGKTSYDFSTFTLSTFDMSHAYKLVAGMQKDGTLKGEFWSGKTGYKTWTAVKDENAKLPDADQITFLKEGYDQLAFSFPNLEKQLVSLQDEKYKGKPVIVQILGSWCPNCMDETAFLAPWYANNKSRGVEIIGLAYEQSPDFEVAKRRVEAMKKRFNIEYEVLIAGTNNNEAASKTLPMLHKINAFPTTIYIDKKGKVRKIYTGFTGPGTGVYYERFKSEFEELMNTLIEEKR